MANYPKFGASAGYQSVTQASKFEQSELVIGNQSIPFIKNGQIECSNVVSTCFWGIAPPDNWNNFATFDDIVVSMDDEILPDYIPNGLSLTANGNGELIPNDLTKPMQVLSCCQIIKAHISIKVTGKISGVPTISVGGIGGLPPMKTAIGNFDINTLIAAATDVEVMSVNSTDSNDAWSTAIVEWKGTISKQGGASIVKNAWSDVGNVDCGDGGLSGYDFCNSFTVEAILKATDYATIRCTRIKHPMKA